MALDAPQGPLVVHATCVSCGAPLDLDEGSTAVRCAHCGVHLLVTGRRQVLCFTVRTAIGAARASQVGGGASPRAARLWLVPYYRLVATELRWQRDRGSVPPGIEGGDTRGLAAWAIALMSEGKGVTSQLAGRSAARSSRHDASIEFQGRRIERSLLACAAVIGPPSLGARSGVVRLDLLDRMALPAGVHLAAPTLTATDAARMALSATGDEEIVRREIIGRLLSLIYYPFWVVVPSHAAATRVVVDGVSGAVTRADVDPAVEERLGRELPSEPDRKLSFRPLLCPNCGGSLPVEPSDVVFACSSCGGAWLTHGDRLLAVTSTTMAPPARIPVHQAEYRPFWELPCVEATHGRVLVPAFRHGSLKRLLDLAIAVTRVGGTSSEETTVSATERIALRGCALDGDDAAAIARFLAADERPGRRAFLPLPGRRGSDARNPGTGEAPRSASDAFDARDARLRWLPFLRDAYGLREPRSGMALLPELRA